MNNEERKKILNDSLTKIREIILQIPKDYVGGKFIGGSTYKISLWNVNNSGIKNYYYIIIIKKESEKIIFGGMEGLKILQSFAFNEIPSFREIYSLRRDESRDTPYLKKCGEKYSLLFPERVIPVDGIIVSFEKI